MNARGQTDLEVVNAEPLNLHNRALYEAGKSILVDSTKSGPEFCKFMVGISSGSIGAYLAIAKLIVPNLNSSDDSERISALAPVVLFLLATIIFTVGCLPRRTPLSLEVAEEIEQVRIRAIERSQRWIGAGFGVFSVGVLWASLFTLFK